MAIQDVLSSDTPNTGRAKWNANAAELDGRVTTAQQTADGRVKNAGGFVEVLTGPEASRPAPGAPDRRYRATDTGREWRDTGTAWGLELSRDWADLTGKPASFPPAAHGHLAADLPAATATGPGISEQATDAEIQAGTAGNLFATAARLKAELDRRLAHGAWVDASLLNGWVNYDTVTFWPAQYRKMADGLIQVRGIVKSGALGTPILNLPAGFRPGKTEGFPASNSAGAGQVNVSPNGDVSQVGPTQGNAYQYLFAIFEGVL